MLEAITPDKLANILALPNKQAEAILHDRSLYVDRITKLSFGEMGLISRTIHDTILHEQRMDPETGRPMTFPQWMAVSFPWSRATAYAAMRTLSEFPDIPIEELVQIPQANFVTLKQISTGVRAKPDVLEAAKTKQSPDLAEHIERNYPDQHIRRPTFKRFAMDPEDEKTLEDAIAYALEHGMASNRSEALVRMAHTALEEWRYESEVQEVAEAQEAGA